MHGLNKRVMVFGAAVCALVTTAAVAANDRKHSTPTVVISFDGAQTGVIEGLLRSGKLPWNGGFGKLIREGTRAKGMTSVLPTVTATNHITLATGAYPERTNIPANTFHLLDTPLTTTTSGFGAAIEAETLWEAAKRQNKKVITISFAGADGRGDARRGDQTLGFGVRDGFSFVKSMNGTHFDSASAIPWNLGNQACEFAKANLGTATANRVFFSTFSLGQVFVNVLVCDAIFDGQESYDTVFFDFDKDLGNGFIARMRQGDWAPFTLPLAVPADPTFADLGRGKVGAWVKLVAFDPALSSFIIYLGDIAHNVGFHRLLSTRSINPLVSGLRSPIFSTSKRAASMKQPTWSNWNDWRSILKDAMLLASEKYDFDLLMG